MTLWDTYLQIFKPEFLSKSISWPSKTVKTVGFLETKILKISGGTCSVNYPKMILRKIWVLDISDHPPQLNSHKIMHAFLFLWTCIDSIFTWFQDKEETPSKFSRITSRSKKPLIGICCNIVWISTRLRTIRRKKDTSSNRIKICRTTSSTEQCFLRWPDFKKTRLYSVSR